jgi:hypothetical protein
MQSKTEVPAPVITFPAPKTTPPTEADRRAAEEHDRQIHDICKDTSMALQELRSGIVNVLADTIDKMDVDQVTLVQLFDERPSVVADLMAGETDGLTTETLIAYLAKLRA